MYKRFDEDYDDRCYFGIISNVHNDGNNTIIEATEYRYSWSTLEVDYKILRGEKDYIIFPCTLEEFNLDLEKAKKESSSKIKSAKETIEKEEKILAEINSIMSGEKIKNLTEMSYKELSQEQYEQKLKELN